MEHVQNNYAFIDIQNLHKSTKQMGWKIDYRKLYAWLKNKYQVRRAFIFIGYISENKHMYEKMRKNGFEIIFKPTVRYKNTTIKGNCDAELVMHVMLKLHDFEQAIIISGDGDFYSLCEYLISINKLKRLMIPNQQACSTLLKKFGNFLTFMSDTNLRDKLKERR